jgi:short-subunit dehydrogenase
VVTGASSGIRRAFAQHLAGEGVHVVLAARSADRLREIGQSLNARYGVEHRVVPVDLSDGSGAQRLIHATEDLDAGVLISNAGDGMPKDFLDHEMDELHRQLTLNAASHLELAHHFDRRLVRRGGGGIIFASASGGFHGIPHMANIAAAKGYVRHLGEALHHELAPAGVNVMVLLPGNVDTPIVTRIGLRRSDFPLSLMAPDAAVEQAMRALIAGMATLVPGRALRLALGAMPRGASVRLNGKIMARAMARNTPPASTAEPAA